MTTPDDDELQLPYGRGRPQPESVVLAASRFADARDAICDAGAGKIKPLDREAARAAPRAKGREADWIATTEALYYAVPAAGIIHRWPWDDITLRLRKRGRRFAKVDLVLPDRVVTLGLGTAASHNLFTIAEWARRRSRDDHADQ